MPAIIEPTPPPAPGETPRRLGAKLAWFAGLWLAGAGLTALVAYGLRLLLLAGGHGV